MDVSTVPGIGKLLEYAASGIGSVAGPMLAPWRARREAHAKRIAAKGAVEAQRILAEGQVRTLDTILGAQASAREKLGGAGVAFQSELTIAEMVSQRVQFQEEKDKPILLPSQTWQPHILTTQKFQTMIPTMTGRPNSSTMYRMFLLKRCNCFGRKCLLARLNGQKGHPFGP